MNTGSRSETTPADFDQHANNEPDLDEILGWAEFCCWTALVLAPIIYWLQGPSVSYDQFVVRSALVVFAVIGGLGLRAQALFWRRQTTPTNLPDPPSQTAPRSSSDPSAPEIGS